MELEDKIKAIHFIRPNAEFVIREDELEWLDDTQPKPTNVEIEEGLVAYKAKIEAEKAETAAKRQAALTKLAALGLDSDDLKALGF